jgi:surface polysaccharide O-acyltransferase-like enzyme
MFVKVLRGQPGFHLWYIFMIPGLYLFMPFLKRFVAAASRTERRAAIVSILAVGSVHMLVTSTTSVTTGASAFSTFVPYTGFLLCGHELVRSGRWRWSRKLLWVGIVACVVTVAFSADLTTDRWGPFTGTRPAYHPLSPVVILFSILVFQAVRSLPESRLSPLKGVLQHLGAMSLGIYLIHPLWMIAWADATHNSADLPVIASLFLQPVAVLLGSYLSVFLISRVPILRRVVV